MITMYVKAAPDLKVPKEGSPRTYITAPEAVVPSHYYRKAVSDGDLVELTEKEWAAFVAERTAAEEAAAAAAATEAAAAKPAAKK
jgi:hypothetical protein